MKGITLIGMPGSGKSTVGKVLAERLGSCCQMPFLLQSHRSGCGSAKNLERYCVYSCDFLPSSRSLLCDFATKAHSATGPLGWKFIDLDVLILEKEGIGHEKILAKNGAQALLDLENKYTLGLDMARVVFSPGGSIVYSKPAMEKLQRDTLIVYLDVPFEEVRARIGENPGNSRGIVGLEEKGLDGLFLERTPLFAKYAHYTIQSLGREPEDVAETIISNFVIPANAGIQQLSGSPIPVGDDMSSI